MRGKLILILVVIVFILGSILYRGALDDSAKKKELQLISELDKIVKISELNTYTAVYNGVATSFDDNKEVEYYVSYEAVIKLGINFEEISISIDNESGVIVIDLPEIEMLEVNVDIGSLDYIFMKKNLDESTVLNKAYSLCIADARIESEAEYDMTVLAEQNTKNIVRALVNPFIENVYSDYTMVFE